MGKTTHDLSNHPLYRVWGGIKQRCYNPKNTAYPRYGQVGVTMCADWIADFKVFYTWAISNGWKPGLELDKDILCEAKGISPKLYSPNTCQFITPRENGMASSHIVITDEAAKRIVTYLSNNANTFEIRKTLCKQEGITPGQLQRFLSSPRGRVKGNTRGKAGVLTQYQKEEIVHKREQGIPYKRIGEDLGVNWSTCRSYWNKYKKLGNCHE